MAAPAIVRANVLIMTKTTLTLDDDVAATIIHVLVSNGRKIPAGFAERQATSPWARRILP
jgi:hypothetical protein